jgi:hypothetical protein
MTLFRFTKKTVSIIVLLALSMSLMTTARASQTSSDDLKGHWAESELHKWVEGDLLKGYNGAYYPDRPITRAELITLINRSFKLSETTEIKFSDLAPSHWAYDQSAIAVKAGYVKGYDDQTIRLDQTIAREESAVMVANLLELEPSGVGEIAQFKDAASISAWSKSAILALVNKSIMIGNANGDFAPQGKLTRAEAVTLLGKAIGYVKPTATVYSTAGVYGPDTGTKTIKGDVVVSAPGVTLQNVIIEGSLTLAASIGEGDANFKKVTVKGTTTIQGGGSNSIHFDDSVLVRISIDKRSGTVRVVVVGESSVQQVVVHSPVKLEESNVTNSGFANVELSKDMPAGSQVQLIGQFEDVQVLTSDIKVSVPSGSIKQLNVGEGTTNTEIDVNANATVMDLVLNSVAKLLGQGTIAKATVNSGATGSTFQTQPTALDTKAAEGKAVDDKVATPTPTPSSDTTSNTGGSPGGNTGGDNGGDSGNVTCTGTTDECRNARLLNLTVSGYTMNQLDADQYITDQVGFNPEVLAYSVVTTRTMAQPVTTTLSVTKSTYSTVRYDVWDKGTKNLKSGTITDDHNSFELEINAKQDFWIRISVNSGDGIGSKVYQVYIQYPRTLQEALKIGSYAHQTTVGQTVYQRTYELQKGTLQGDRIHATDSVLLFEAGDPTPFLTCTSYSCALPNEKVSTSSGVWNVEVKRGDTLLASGEYRYDFTNVEVLTSDIGLEVIPYTKQELINEFVNGSNLPAPIKYGYKVYVDTEKLTAAVPRAKYFVSGGEDMIGETTSFPQGLSVEDLKVGILPNGYSGSNSLTHVYYFYNNSTKRQQIFGSFYLNSDDEMAPKFVNDMFVYTGVFDENFELLGQYITVLQFDQEHVADGFTAVGNWNPTP